MTSSILKTMDVDDYKYWVSNSTGLIYHACFINGLIPASPESYTLMQNYFDGFESVEDIQAQQVKATYETLRDEALKKNENKIAIYDVWKQPVSEDTKADYRISFTASELIKIAENVNIELPEAFYNALTEQQQYDNRFATDFIFRMNENIKQGADVSDAHLYLEVPWKIEQFHYIVFGEGNLHDKSWDKHQQDEKYYHGMATSTSKNGWVYKDGFYSMLEYAGHQNIGNIILNYSPELNPVDWKLHPENCLRWCHEKGISLREQLLNLIGKNPSHKVYMKLVDMIPDFDNFLKVNIQSLETKKQCAEEFLKIIHPDNQWKNGKSLEVAHSQWSADQNKEK